jgi:alpha-amylase
MSTVHFAFVVHNHQPVGQLPHVFDEAWEKSYLPFLDVLERHPHVKCVLHYTGPLLDWFLTYQPYMIERVCQLVSRGQVEILAGGYYEPILAMIPPRDALAQIQKLQRAVHETFGCHPQGIWLAERWWDPALADLLPQANVRYTLVDSTVFEQAGIREEETLNGFQIHQPSTINHQPLTIFPIHQSVRHQIPFADPPEKAVDAIASLVTRHSSPVTPLVVFADDGEKFGIWPDTFWWVYETGWLDRFFSALERNAHWIQPTTLAEYLAHPQPSTLNHLPLGSYSEMMQWSGGDWRNFLEKYAESKDLRQQIWRLSESLPVDEPPPDALLRAESNDVFWHGVFGGLYLKHLRLTAWRNLNEARRETGQRVNGSMGQWLVRFEPEIGGSIVELSHTLSGHNFLATLMRRREPYHGQTPPPVDWHPRRALLDHFLGAETTLESFAECRYPEQGDFVNQPYDVRSNDFSRSREQTTKVVTTLSRLGHVWVGAQHLPIQVDKTVEARDETVLIHYELTNPNDTPVDLWFGVEFNFVLTHTEPPDCSFTLNDEERHSAPSLRSLSHLSHDENATALTLVDHWLNLRLRLSWDAPAGLWHCPIMTASQAIEGIQWTHQSSAFLLHWKLHLPPKETWRVCMKIES